MKKITFFILFLAIMPFLKLSAQCAQTANIYSFTYNGHTYEIVKEMKTWINASACAVERGGYLVEINDQAEQNYIYSKIQAAGISTTYTQVGDGGGTAYIWIGATDKVTEGNWKWDGTNSENGTAFWTGQGAAGAGGGMAVGGAYVNWGGKSTSTINEPDDYGGQDAAAIALAGWPAGTTMLGIGGEWNDIALTNSIYFIIEKNSVGINENKKSNDIQIFPVPAKDYIQLHGINNENAIIKIINIQGIIINEFISSELIDNKININTLPNGFYFAKIYINNNVFIVKFVK